MTTEKRKRLPKPTKTWQVQALIDLVPFLQADHRHLCWEAIEWVKKYPPSSGSRSFLTPGVLDINVNELAEIHRNLCEAMRFAYGLQNSDSKGTSKWMTEARRGVTEEIMLGSGTIMHSWIPAKPTDRDWHNRYFAGMAVMVLCEALGANLTPKIDPNTQPNLEAGKAYVGVCPNCRKIFQKPRLNAEYCGKTCADTASKRRQRKRTSVD